MIVLVPIPTDLLGPWQNVWFPFLEQIAQRSRNSIPELMGHIVSNEIHIHLAWEPETKTAHALAGTRIILRGGNRVGELVWATGSGRKHWLPLLADLESYHRDHLGCVGMNAIARRGWLKDLRARGYRITHLTFEKDF